MPKLLTGGRGLFRLQKFRAQLLQSIEFIFVNTSHCGSTRCPTRWRLQLSWT